MVAEAEEARRRELQRRQREEEEVEENIRRHQELMAARQEAADRKKAEEKARADAQFRAVAAQTERQRSNDDEMRQLRDMLWEEELEAKRRADDARRLDKLKADKVAMMAANQEQLRQRVARRAREEEQERALVADMLAKFREDEANQRAQEERALSAKLRLREEIEVQRAERSRLYEQEKLRALEELRAEQERAEYEAEVVAEARRRLLEQHAEALAGFMPKGTLKSEEELQLIQTVTGARQQVAPHYT
jgi:hypothetical protein